MSALVDPAVIAALEDRGRTRVIVTFDHRPTGEELAAYDVVFEFGSIKSAALRIDHEALDRLIADDSVVSVEADGEVRALD